MTMNISLTSHLEEFIRRKVESGRYHSASEVVREALRLLEEREVRLEDLRREIRKGMDAIERGDYTEYADKTLPDLVERIHTEGMKRSRGKEHV